MFGAIISAMLIVYAVLTVAMVIMLPLTVIQRMRRELMGEAVDAEPRHDSPDADEQEEKRQLTRVRLQTTAEAVVRSHDRILEDWVAHLQDEQMSVSPGQTSGDGDSSRPDPAVQQRLLDALDTAQHDRLDPADPALDHYTVGLYATRVRELEAAWTAYRQSSSRWNPGCDA